MLKIIFTAEDLRAVRYGRVQFPPIPLRMGRCENSGSEGETRMANRYGRRRDTGSRFITAKYAGVCAETGKAIAVGERCMYSGGKIYHQESESYRDFAGAEFDRVVLGREY